MIKEIEAIDPFQQGALVIRSGLIGAMGTLAPIVFVLVTGFSPWW